MAAPGISSTDFLRLSSKPGVHKLLVRESSGTVVQTQLRSGLLTCNTVLENVIFSDLVTKINRKDKSQERALMVTDKAMYNLLPSDFSKCKRRIPHDQIHGITKSTVSDEFVIHVPSEYDYRLCAPRKDDAVRAIQSACSAVGNHIVVHESTQMFLREVCLTKDTKKRLQKTGQDVTALMPSRPAEPASGSEAKPDLAREMAQVKLAVAAAVGDSPKPEDDEDLAEDLAPGRARRQTGWSRDTTDVTLESFNLLKVRPYSLHRSRHELLLVSSHQIASHLTFTG